MKLLILESAESLIPDDTMVAIRPVDVLTSFGHHITGYCALIKNEKTRELRLGELQAREESFDVNTMTL